MSPGSARPNLYLKKVWVIFIVLLLVDGGCGRKVRLPYRIELPRERKGIYHVVERGQTLWRICRTYGVDMQEVAELNNIEDISEIKVGQRIFIPGAKRPLKVIPGPPPTDTSIAPQKIFTSRERFIWPVNGRVTTNFGIWRGKKHDGIDIAAPIGTPVRAAAAGKVIFKGNLRGYGKILIVRHDNDFTTVYAHLHSWKVKLHDRVKQGQVIALVGDSGKTSGSHLHFEIRHKSKARNPLFFLPRKGKK